MIYRIKKINDLIGNCIDCHEVCMIL